jgi:hypothetical protein
MARSGVNNYTELNDWLFINRTTKPVGVCNSQRCLLNFVIVNPMINEARRFAAILFPRASSSSAAACNLHTHTCCRCSRAPGFFHIPEIASITG